VTHTRFLAAIVARRTRPRCTLSLYGTRTIELLPSREVIRYCGEKQACRIHIHRRTAWFLNHQIDDGPACRSRGQPATSTRGIERAAQILVAAPLSLIYGLSDTTSESQRVAVSIADWTAATSTRPRVCAWTVGAWLCKVSARSRARFGEVRNTAPTWYVLGSQPRGKSPPALHAIQLDAEGHVHTQRPQGPHLCRRGRAEDEVHQDRGRLSADQTARRFRGL